MSSSENVISSCESYLNLLREQDTQIVILGLDKLCVLVDYNWAEIAEHLSLIEQLYEDERFQKRDQAAYLASKVYFHLEQYEEALNLALESNSYFNLTENSLYVQSLVSTCVDKYTMARQQNYDASKKEDCVPINKKYEDVINYLFDQSFRQNNFKQIIGIAIESRRLDKIEELLQADAKSNQSNSNNDLLNYIYDISMNVLTNLKFRNELLRLIVDFYRKKQLQPMDYINLSQCYYFLNDYESIVQILYNLGKSEKQDDILLSYQIANDISENENLYFIDQVKQAFPIEQGANQQQIRSNLIKVLTGEIREQSHQLFLKNNYKADQQVIQKIKNSISEKSQVPHQAFIMSHSIFNAGTSNLDFFSEPKIKEFFDKASNWAKFTRIAGLGVINKGFYHIDVFKDYMPKGDQANPNYYQNGGALYGIGLQYIGTKNQAKNQEIIDIISNDIFSKQETIIHGACLALGLINLGSKDEELCQRLMNIMQQNEAVVGEASALAIGLIMAGSGDDSTIQQLVNYGQETDHEKIIRAIGLSLSLTMFNKRELADTLIEQLIQDKDAILRQGGCMTMGMAYAGSGSTKIVQRLLNLIVHEVADDTKRQAVIAIGFVLFRQPEALIRIIKQLILSFNPHIRYGTAIAIGIACAGTMYKDALDILEPMLEDTVDFVRQAAYISLAMVVQQANNQMEPRLEKFKKKIDDIAGKKMEDVLVRLGAILASSILEAGGRNQVIKLASNAGVARLGSCVGLQVFINFWYWFPLVHFFNLTLQPACIIGLNQDFKIPVSFEFQCNAKPSQFDYIPPLKTEEKKEQVKQQSVSLSVTQKAKLKKEKKSKPGPESEMQLLKLQSQSSQMSSLIQQSTSMKKEDSLIKKPEDKEKMDIEEKKQEEPQEPSSFVMKNPSRVLDKQKKFIQYIENRYQPIIKERKNGLVFLIDTKPGTPDQYLNDQKGKANMDLEVIKEKSESKQQASQSPDPKEDEIQPPEDFTYEESNN